MASLRKWRDDNAYNPDGPSNSTGDLFASTTFFLWVTVLYYDPSYFEADRVLFEPLQHQVHADCYGFLLVARRLGLNIITDCISKGSRMLRDCLSRFPEVHLGTDRDVRALNFRSH